MSARKNSKIPSPNEDYGLTPDLVLRFNPWSDGVSDPPSGARPFKTFNTFLVTQPKCYQKVKKWQKEENRRIHQKLQQHHAVVIHPSSNPYQTSPPGVRNGNRSLWFLRRRVPCTMLCCWVCRKNEWVVYRWKKSTPGTIVIRLLVTLKGNLPFV